MRQSIQRCAHRSARAMTLALAAGGVLGFAPSSAEAQGAKFDVRAGVAVPRGDLADFTDPGFTAGAGVALALNPRLYLRFDGDLSRMSEVDTDGDTSEQFFGSSVDLWSYGAGLEYSITDPEADGLQFQITGGAGLTTIDPEVGDGIDVPNVPDFGTETRFTTSAAVTLGVKPHEEFSIFLRGRANVVFLDEDVFDSTRWWSFPIQLGIQLGG